MKLSTSPKTLIQVIPRSFLKMKLFKKYPSSKILERRAPPGPAAQYTTSRLLQGNKEKYPPPPSSHT